MTDSSLTDSPIPVGAPAYHSRLKQYGTAGVKLAPKLRTALSAESMHPIPALIQPESSQVFVPGVRSVRDMLGVALFVFATLGALLPLYRWAFSPALLVYTLPIVAAGCIALGWVVVLHGRR